MNTSTRIPTARLAIAGAALALLSLSAQAHRPWLMPSATQVDGPAPLVTVDAAISEDLFEFDSFPLQLETLRVTAPDGSTIAPDTRAEAKRRISFDVKLAQKGTYRITGFNDTVMVTYKLAGETRRWRGTAAAMAKEIPAGAQDVQSSHMLQRAETFVTNDAPSAIPGTVSGEGIELLPLTNPTDLSVGDSSRFRLLLDGKPYADADVTVIRGGNRYRYKMGELALKTDAKGEFSVAWTEAGRYWLGANHGGRPQGGPGGPGAEGGPGAGGPGAGPGGAPGAGPNGAMGAGPMGGPPAGRRESYSATFEVLPK
jgi:uncharacterized GH25 family protein